MAWWSGSPAATFSGCHCTASSQPRAGRPPAPRRSRRRAGGDDQALPEAVDRLVVGAATVDLRRPQLAARGAGVHVDAGRPADAPGTPWSQPPGRSLMSWWREPPSATLSTWRPRQMASSGRPGLTAARHSASSKRSTTGSAGLSWGPAAGRSGRVDIGAAGEQQAGEAPRRLGDAGGRGGVDRREDGGDATGPLQRLEVVGRRSDAGRATGGRGRSAGRSRR